MATAKKITKTKTSSGSSSGVSRSETLRKAIKKAPEARAPLPRAEKAAQPLEAPNFSMEGKRLETLTLPAELFGVPWRRDLVHQVVTALQANLRQNRAHTKDRAEVSGGGRKPWKQKGTGQARHGSIRSPLWRKGGITFGPRVERNYAEKINRKAKVQALLSALSKKAADGEIIFVDTISFAAPKTGAAARFLKTLGAGAGVELASRRNNAALIALSSYDGATVKSFRNIGNVASEELRTLTALDVLSHRYLVIDNPQAAYAILNGRIKK